MLRILFIIFLTIATLLTAAAWLADCAGGAGIRWDGPPGTAVLHAADGYVGLRVLRSGSAATPWRITTVSADQLTRIFFQDMLRPVGVMSVSWQIPLWIVTAAVVVLWGVFIARRPLSRAHRRKRGLCVKCGYNLTGNESGVCSECGKEVKA